MRNMRFVASLLCRFTTFVCYGLVSTVGLAQTYPGAQADIDSSVTHTKLIIADIRPKLFSDLPPAEQKRYEEIKFDVTPDNQNPRAFATRRAGVRTIVVTEAMGRLTELNADALLMEMYEGLPNFLNRYMAFGLGEWRANHQRYVQGLPPHRVPSPYEFAHWSSSQLDEFYSNRKIAEARNKLWGGAFAFILAHEVAHHVLGHVDHPTDDIDTIRTRESAADAWAIDLLVRKTISPVAGIVPMLVSYCNGTHPAGIEEREADHPADARRLLAMLEGLENRLPSFKSSIIASGQDYETVHKQVQLALSIIGKEVPEETATDATSFCSDLKSYISSALVEFSNLRGTIDPDGGGEAYHARRGIAGFHDCTVWIYRDQTNEPSSSCTGNSTEKVDEVRASVAECLGPEFSTKTHTARNGFIFAAHSGVTVRITNKTSGQIDLWIDSPSRN